MKNYQVILLVIVAFAVGVMAGPTLLEFIDNARLHKVEKKHFSKSEKIILEKQIRDYAYLDLIARYGPPVKAIEKLVLHSKIGEQDNMALFSMISHIKSMEARLRLKDKRGVEDDYNAILKLIKNNPQLNQTGNMRDIALINYAHCLAGKAAIRDENPKLAIQRFDAAIKVLSEIDDLYWLATYAYAQQARVFIEEKEYKNAITNLNNIYRYQRNSRLNASGGTFRIGLLINLAYLNLKIGEKKHALFYARKGIGYTSITAKQRKSELYRYFNEIKDAAANKKDSKSVLENQKKFWQRSSIPQN